MPPLQENRQRSVWGPGFWASFLGCGIVLVLVVPALNFWMPTGSPAALPDYLVPLLGKYICYALLALSLDLIWGYAGILSLPDIPLVIIGQSCKFAVFGEPEDEFVAIPAGDLTFERR